ncbi:kinase-like domain-containing protein [Fomitopsis serialis]|uniref:kinase-like domain-containing protein n=1 Tax=Fomitopsis serialis TaxID=139415 RepID=UPI002007CD2D|nr:kinase-like domain-containing protein [Neoantrodia serialis]KAH9924153.1 kinase-like domain-containing protein [Neoantrodia serialis]
MALESMAYHMPDFRGRLIDAGRLELVRLLGAGGCGVVYLAVDHHAPSSSSSKATPVRRAVKIIRKVDTPDIEYQRREIDLHSLVSGIPHVLPLHYAFEDEHYFYLVTEYCETDLYKVLFESQTFHGNDELVRSAFLQILDAVHACHQKRVFHRDLKPENILCSADGSDVYIADFGLATQNSRSATFGCGSAPYLSPVLIKATESVGQEFSQQAYSTKRADVWALGIILVNMITGLGPWEKAVTEDPRFCEHLLDDGYLERVIPASRGVIQVLKKVFRINPQSRPSLEQLRQSIVNLDNLFPARKEVETSTPALSSVLVAGVVPQEVVVDVEEDEERITDPGEFYEYDDDSDEEHAYLYIGAVDDTADSDSECTSVDESGPATPSSFPVPLNGSEFVEGLEKALLPLTDAGKPVEPASEVSILARLDLLVLE